MSFCISSCLAFAIFSRKSSFYSLLRLLSPLLLLERYNTWVPVYDLGPVGGTEPNTFYARVSLQVYNDESDVHFLSKAILDILKQHK